MHTYRSTQTSFQVAWTGLGHMASRLHLQNDDWGAIWGWPLPSTHMSTHVHPHTQTHVHPPIHSHPPTCTDMHRKIKEHSRRLLRFSPNTWRISYFSIRGTDKASGQSQERATDLDIKEWRSQTDIATLLVLRVKLSLTDVFRVWMNLHMIYSMSSAFSSTNYEDTETEWPTTEQRWAMNSSSIGVKFTGPVSHLITLGRAGGVSVSHSASFPICKEWQPLPCEISGGLYKIAGYAIKDIYCNGDIAARKYHWA